ncbi:retrovirus-related pol polyprotein from transposon TNT 1-94 [Tanacetum coccineum]|uniref:Retrovirus-related pol polyprotein from transposon TNT 1-94 n=1 Tax=Tanacetum coccineum TaxID=301880 RepID=A0ABQ5FDM1_9ASTR
MTTIRLVLSIVALKNLHLEQLDVKTSFLHGDLEEDIYMAQPEGFKSAEKEENLMCKLKKIMYGLKQASRQWYLKFDRFMQRAGYKRCAMDHCCYLKKVGSSYIILLLYVDDDMFGSRPDMAEIRSQEAVRLCQPLGEQFKLRKKQAPKTEAFRRIMAKVLYASVVGSVMYVMVCARPDIAHVVGVVSRFMFKSGREHWEAVKWLLRYLKGTLKATLCFRRKEVVLEGFFNSDYGGCLDSDKKSEYMAIAKTGKKLSAIHFTKNPVFHGRTKHIKIRYHYIRELVSEGTLYLKKILRTKNPADMLTKVVTREKLKLCTASTGLRDN